MVGVFELFKIGIGPSSSHTVGPMKAALSFVRSLEADGLLGGTSRLRVDLYGSLAWTGRGHATDRAILLGLGGEAPATVDLDRADAMVRRAHEEHLLALPGGRDIGFDSARDIVFDTLAIPPHHPNTLAFSAFDDTGALLRTERWCSVGGGFVVREEDAQGPLDDAAPVAIPFRDAAELLLQGQARSLSIAGIVMANERSRRSAGEVEAHVDAIIDVMMTCIDRGLETEGELPGGLRVKRRAKAIRDRLARNEGLNARFSHEVMDHVSLYAMAVNEENAAGGRVVTAPTNGAAGVIPAVLRYYRDHCPGATTDNLRLFLLTATAIGALFKMNASISGAEVGCQGEVGVACSMAAAGLAAALGGTNEQIENAAEIGMEHHLGMTCDPIGGLVQIPCIERNAFGAVKAITAASLALHGDGTHKVSLDHVIATMRQTGADMSAKYKETSQGGLAVNFIEC